MAANGRKPKNELETVRYLLANVRPNDKGCMISHLRPNAKGYVPVQPNGNDAPKWRAHRLVYHVLIENVTSDMQVMHTCDVRNCINPKHLKLGTAHDNTQDMMAKGRHKYENANRVVSAEMVECFKLLRNEGYSNVKIAEKYGISHETVRSHLNGSTNVAG